VGVRGTPTLYSCQYKCIIQKGDKMTKKKVSGYVFARDLFDNPYLIVLRKQPIPPKPEPKSASGGFSFGNIPQYRFFDNKYYATERSMKRFIDVFARTILK
jgi:hypothetical protein